MAKIYISSTYSDLKDYREAVYQTLRQLRYDVIAMEDYVAADQRPLDRCLADVAECDVYIGIFAWRYGHIPSKNNPEGKSITELEFRKACETGKTRLIFLLDENASWPFVLTDAKTGEGGKGQRIEELRQEVRGDKLVSSFKTTDELAKLVSVSLSRHEQEKRIRSGLEEQRQSIVRESELQQSKPRQRVVGQRLLDVGSSFKGRSKEQSELSRLLAEPSTHVVSVIGRGGIGKTALASKILTDLEQGRWLHAEDPLPVDGIVYLSTRTAGITLDRIFLDCARMLGGKQEQALISTWANPHMKIEDKIQSLLGTLSEGLYVLLLDHVDDLLDDRGEITNEGVRAFFEISLATPQSARLLLTSRIPLAFRREAQRFDKRVPLWEGLSVPEGLAMLRELDPRGETGLRDASDEQLTRAVERVHGIPRALEVLAGILADDPLTSLEDVLKRFYQYGNVADELIKEGYKRLDDNARRVMEALGIFGRPVPLPALDYLLQPFIPGLDTPEIIRRLIRAQMVLVTRETRMLSLHPFDQDYIYSQCPDLGKYNCQALERRAADWYVQIRVPEHFRNMTGLEPLLLEFDHRVRAGDYDDAAAVLSEIDVEYLIPLGHSTRALAMRQKLDGKITNRRLQMLHAYGLAHAYQVLGPFTKAKDYFEETLAFAREVGDSRMEAESLRSMAEVSRRLGRLDDAKNYLSDAINLYRAIGDQRKGAQALAHLSILCSYRGNPKEALDHGQTGLSLSRSLGDTEGQALAFDALSLAYLAVGDLKQAIQQGEEAIAMYRKSTWEHTLIYVLNVLGLAHIGLGHMDEGLTCLHQALQQAREDKDTRVEGLALFNLARAYRMKKDPAAALNMASAAMAVFTETGGGEAPAARALVEVIQAANAGLKSAEARALLDCARHSRMTPDLHNPSDLVEEARAIARAEGLAEILQEAQGLARTEISP